MDRDKVIKSLLDDRREELESLDASDLFTEWDATYETEIEEQVGAYELELRERADAELFGEQRLEEMIQAEIDDRLECCESDLEAMSDDELGQEGGQ